MIKSGVNPVRHRWGGVALLLMALAVILGLGGCQSAADQAKASDVGRPATAAAARDTSPDSLASHCEYALRHTDEQHSPFGRRWGDEAVGYREPDI